MSMINKGDSAQTSTGRGQTTGAKSVLNINSLFNTRVQRSAAGESLSAYADAMKAIFVKDNVPENTFQIITVDSSVSSLVCGVIALVMRKGDRAAVYSYIVESTIQGQLADRTFKQPGQPDFTIPSTAGDVYNYGPEVFNKVISACEAHISGISEWEQAGADVIPVELKATDENHMRNVLHRGSSALETLVEEKPALNIAELAPTTSFITRIEFPNDQTETAAGLPTRRSYNITLNGTDRNVAHQSMVQQNQINLASLAGYVDIMFTDSVPVPNGNGGMMPSTQKFQPKLVITDSTPNTHLITPELQLLSLASITQLVRSGTAWLTALRSRYNEDGSNIHSLNGLRHELNDDTLDVDAPDFDMFGFANLFFHAPSVELHIPECSDTTWILSMFRDAARGVAGAQEAVIQAANNLTNGNFSKHFEGGPVAGLVEDRVVMGYYFDKSGKMRDIRDIDYLAVLNLLGASDKAMAFEFADTYNPSKGTLEYRLNRRIDIIKTVLSGNAKIKGYATPVLLSPKMLKALHAGLSDCGCNMNIEGYLEQYRQQSRGNTAAMDFGIRPDAFGSAYSGYGAQQSNFDPHFQGRRW